jgi:pyruvate kinase
MPVPERVPHDDGFPAQKTRIVATIGPASASVETLQRMIRAGVSVCRLNFAHGDFDSHGATIAMIREAARATGRRVAILADMPGPKLRIGGLADDCAILEPGATVTLTTEDVVGDAGRLSVNFPELPRVVSPGNAVFLSDGFIQLIVEEVRGSDVRCRVESGGPLTPHKGVNLPGIRLGIAAHTERDGEVLRFAVEQGLDIVSQSFVQRAEDIEIVRTEARAAGGDPFIVAKIERAGAVAAIEGIVRAADGIMVARGDLGVETPIERIALLQKRLIRTANRLARPVITATQMLESMTRNPRSTRAEATDVANAVLDGTDAVMLSEESATGAHPVEAVAMLARIAAAAEHARDDLAPVDPAALMPPDGQATVTDVLALDAATTVRRIAAGVVVVPTPDGDAARRVARFKLPQWSLAVSASEATCQSLCLSYGVHPVHIPRQGDWPLEARRWLREAGIAHGLAVVVEGRAEDRPGCPGRLEVHELATDG